jgi:predicted methyltransferase
LNLQGEIQGVGLFLQRTPPRRTLLGALVGTTTLNATTKQVLSLSWGERREYLEGLWQFNAKLAEADGSVEQVGLYAVSKTAGVLRRFNQLPCSLASRMRRADLLADAGTKLRKLMILGDDDLLSVELARRGFPQVAVADCDVRLLTRIAQETQELAKPPRLIRADFREGLPEEEKAEICVLDPPNSIAAALTFFRLAIWTVRHCKDAQVYMMINPRILGSNFSLIERFGESCGYEISRHLPAFNSYPLGSVDQLMLRSAWRVLLGRTAPALAPDQPLHYSSDCFVFTRR